MKLFLEALALGKGITLERLGHGNLMRPAKDRVNK
jgi:hypothetical protein